MPNLNEKAPPFSLPDTKKTRVSLGNYQGKQLVLAFYPAAFTGVCEKELCTFRDSLSALNKVGAEVVGISVDPPFSNGAFAEKNGLDFPLLSDYSREVVEAYGVALHDFAGMSGYTAAQRAIFILDGDGIIRYKWIAPNPGVEPDYAEIQSFLS